MLAYEGQDPHRPVRKPHVEATKRICARLWLASAAFGPRPRELFAGRPAALVGQHDQAHDRTQEVDERPVVSFEQARMDHRERRAHDAFNGDVPGLSLLETGPSVPPRLSFGDNSLQPLYHLRAAFERPWPGAERLHHAYASERGL